MNGIAYSLQVFSIRLMDMLYHLCSDLAKIFCSFSLDYSWIEHVQPCQQVFYFRLSSNVKWESWKLRTETPGSQLFPNSDLSILKMQVLFGLSSVSKHCCWNSELIPDREYWCDIHIDWCCDGEGHSLRLLREVPRLQRLLNKPSPHAAPEDSVCEGRVIENGILINPAVYRN